MNGEHEYTEWTYITRDKMEVGARFTTKAFAENWLENLCRIPGYNKEDYTLAYRTTSPWINEQGDVIT